MKCKNCGHEIWEGRYGNWVHKFSNMSKCSGDDKEITNCPCTNPEPEESKRDILNEQVFDLNNISTEREK